MDFDNYPCFHPRSQKVRMVQCDFGLSMMCEFARALDPPWNFGVLTRSIPVPVNALAGEYRIEVRAPQADAAARGTFIVAP